MISSILLGFLDAIDDDSNDQCKTKESSDCNSDDSSSAQWAGFRVWAWGRSERADLLGSFSRNTLLTKVCTIVGHYHTTCSAPTFAAHIRNGHIDHVEHLTVWIFGTASLIVFKRSSIQKGTLVRGAARCSLTLTTFCSDSVIVALSQVGEKQKSEHQQKGRAFEANIYHGIFIIWCRLLNTFIFQFDIVVNELLQSIIAKIHRCYLIVAILLWKMLSKYW